MKTSKKVLSTFLALFMVLTMFSGSAFAADSANQLTGFGSDIASIGITGADVSSATLTTSASNNGNDNNMTYTYNVVLSATTSAEAAVTATFCKSSRFRLHDFYGAAHFEPTGSDDSCRSEQSVADLQQHAEQRSGNGDGVCVPGAYNGFHQI